MSNNSKPKNKHNGGSSHQFNGGGDTSLASDVYEEMMERNMTEKETQTIMLLVRSFESHLSVNFRKFEKHIDAKFASAEKLQQERFAGVDKQFEGVDKQFAGVDKQFAGVQRQFVGVNNKIDELKSDMKEEFAKVRAEAKEHRDETKEEFAKVRAEAKEQFTEAKEQRDDMQKQLSTFKWALILIGIIVGFDVAPGDIVLDIIIKLLSK